MSLAHKEVVRTTIDISIDEHKKLKAIAALRGVSLRELVLDCVREKYGQIPNDETIEAFKQSESGKGLTEYKTVSDIMKSILG